MNRLFCPKIQIAILTVLLFLVLKPAKSHAQAENVGIAIEYPLEEKEIIDGNIVSLAPDGQTLVTTSRSYDEKMFGVIVLSPKAVFRRVKKGAPILRNGEAYINVTDINDKIAPGDYLTSSEIAGLGQKATEMTGFVVGVAISAFDPSLAPESKSIEFKGKKVQIGKVKASIGIGPATPVVIKAGGGLFGTMKYLATAVLFNIGTTKMTDRIARYLISAIVALLTIYVSMLTFGRAITRGIEAIGRNPLAKVSIQSMIVLNIIMVVVVSLSGIALALAILSL